MTTGPAGNIYGMRGGGWLPATTSAEDEKRLTAAVDSGAIRRAACLCTRWLVAPSGLGEVCGECGEPISTQPERRTA